MEDIATMIESGGESTLHLLYFKEEAHILSEAIIQLRLQLVKEVCNYIHCTNLIGRI